MPPISRLLHTPRAAHAFDIPGALLTSISRCLFIVGIGSTAHKAPVLAVALELAGAVIFGALLIRRQAGHPAPMLPVDLFRWPMFPLSVATAVCFAFGAGFGALGCVMSFMRLTVR